ncbi:MAG: class I SAM-dependent methyltransferase [Propionicimonas sp.]|uniref:class I SAM-dependent methyltransferase n=1 Tax=Propionicimonas sp. TaxID=1955623 RepID=UPI003D09A446
MTVPSRATSFGAGVAAYEQGRPEYVDEHVAWLLDGVRGRVLDLAAGSGKLTRAVTRLGFDIVAVDPDAQMLARNTGVETHLGTAEDIPLPDASVAAVTVGQAWHWFDPAPAGPEIARVLVPGGRLGLIWNTRDVTHPFVAELSTIMGASPAELMVDGQDVPPAPGFGPFERARWDRVRWMTGDDLVAMVASRSHYLVADAATQAQIVAGVRDLLARHPHTAGRDRFEYPLHTTAYRADALAGG